MTKTYAAILAAAIACWLASIYWSPYHSCVRALVSDVKLPASEAEASLTCARWVKN
jgi:hypothetical protein